MPKLLTPAVRGISLFSNTRKSGIQFLTIRSMWNYNNFTVSVDLRLEIGEIPDFYRDF